MSADADLSHGDVDRSGEPLYTDEHGVPMLFDVAVPGDYLRAAGVSLVEQAPDVRTVAPGGHPADLEQRIQAAIDAALPKVTERTAAAMREALLKEVRDALRDADAP